MNRTHADTDSEDDDEDVTAYRGSGGSTMHVRDHDTIKPPRMGTKNVSSKLINHYGEMTDGGRAYNKEGSSKNKMSLRHLLKITKQAVEEHQLNDSAAYALFRKALTGKALDNSIISEDNGTDFRNYFLQIQLLNTHQDDKTELSVELDKIRASKPKHMPTTMMRIHEIHNKLNREADSEKACLLYTSPSPRD